MAINNQPVTIQGEVNGTASVALDYTDLTAAAASQVITWQTLRIKSGRSTELPVNAEIMSARLIRGTDFSGGTISAVTVGLGDGGSPTELLSAIDVFTGAKATAPFAVTNQEPQLLEIAAYVAQVTMTSVGDDLAQADAGKCELRIRYRAHDLTSQV